MKSFKNLLRREFKKKLTESSTAVLLDVRTPGEFSSERIPGSINLDVTDNFFESKVGSLDKAKPYFVYCLSGGRSQHACAILADRGFEVYNLAGGISNWTGRIV